ETWAQIASLLDGAMGKLGRKDHDALVLRFFENKNFAEVGAALGASEDAAKMRVGRAMEKLRGFFARRGIHSTAAAIAESISAHSIQPAPAVLAKTVTAVALTKGAAASGSTLTLMKGALKIMAWTKTKTTIVTGVAVLLAAGITTVAVKTISVARTRAALAAMQGSWEGTLSAGPQQMRLVLKIFRTNGAYRATIDSIDQGAKDIPFAIVSAGPNAFHGGIPALGADYQAMLNADGTQMSGTWNQLKNSFHLTLKRTATPDVVQNRLSPDEYAPRSDSDLQGAWEGTLKYGNTPMHLILKIAEPTPGTFRAQMENVDEGEHNLPVALTYQKPAVHFEIQGHQAAFQGILNDAHDRLSGTLTQLSKKFPLTFQREDANTQAAAKAKKDYGQGTSDHVEGHWKGELNANGVKLRILFHIALMPDGSYSATLDSPDQGATGIPATAAQVTYPDVRLEWKGIGGVFTGKLTNGRLSGTWRQGNAALPLELERSMAQ
ncbi:MAG: hypothetical protein KGJ88_13920, partial [Verrucomicrobiota bacterium]|nr:hypothetical protein [Verrucomicrobiota bacterium]